MLIYSKYISNYINKHISKYKDNINGRRFCAVLVYTYFAILRQPCRVPDFSILRRCWSCCGAGGVVSQYPARFVRCGLNIDLSYAEFQYLRVVGCFWPL